MRLLVKCSICQKILEETSRESLDTEVLINYKCGHSFVELSHERMLSSIDGSSIDGTLAARPYQREGIKFILDSNFNCIIGDQMRLGKTPQSLLALKNAYLERTPCLILVRSANIYQWIREYKVWTDSLPLGIYPVIGSKAFIPPGFSAYICSMDTFSREGMVQKFLEFGFKLVIVDEAHSFKNTDSKRSQALIQFLCTISKESITYEVPFTCFGCRHAWTETVTKDVQGAADGLTTERVSKTAYCPKCNGYNHHSCTVEYECTRKCGVILLTGTAIKNRADEYFVPLNIVAPQQFPSKDHFRKRYLCQDAQGKWSRVSRWAMDDFKKVIAPYVLRREKEDVYTDLPELNRIYTIITIDDSRLKAAYNAAVERLEIAATRSDYKFFDTIGELAILRQICGLAKVDWAADYAEAMLTDSDNQRLALGIHHHSVRDSLAYKLSNVGVLKLSGEDSAESKDRIMRQFETSPERILIINTLAGGVGMDFHYCSDVLVLERQWSSADEEQFEFRFYNPDKSIKQSATRVEYIIAKGTIDEFFHDLVSTKRKIFGETIGTNWDLSQDAGSFKELVERTIAGKL